MQIFRPYLEVCKPLLLQTFFVLLVLMCSASGAFAQSLSEVTYDIGSPTLTELWVDPVSGNDSNNGSTRNTAFRTVNAAWDEVPRNSALSTGYRINLLPGTYPVSSIPNYWEDRAGTFQRPIIFRAVDGRGTAIFRGGLNIFNSSYLYFIDIDLIPVPAGDAFHCEQCDHILLRGLEVSGGNNREAQETIKINQSQYFYIEDSDIHGAYDNAIDFVAVQYGHIVRNLIHDAEDWCAYAKGGSAYLRVEGNRIYDCGTGGFTAGQGAGFEFTTSPWIHYDAYSIKVLNNVIHDTAGAGLGVNGGYNILMAHNTLYRVGSRSHAIEVVFGLHGCDGNTSACAARVSAGGWGTSAGGIEEPIPNRNVYIYNNVLYNPSGFRSADQHFAIYGPRTPSGGTNIPSPARTDTNLQIRGNLIWNGPANLPLGIEDSGAGCQSSNSDCNEAQLLADNTINTVQPQLRDPGENDFRPTDGGNLFSHTTYTIPDFAGGDLPATPSAPAGTLANTVSRDRSGDTRSSSTPAGAYATADASLDEPDSPDSDDEAPSVSNVSCTPRKVKVGKRLRCVATVTDDNGLASVKVRFGNKYPTTMTLQDGLYRASWKARGTAGKKLSVAVTAIDSAGQSTRRQGKKVTLK